MKADRLAKRLGVRELYVKDDSVNHPTCSYKDRVVSVAATRAVELGFSVFACASTGNLANSVAAHAARLGLSCYVFIPDDLETGKVTGAAVSWTAHHRRARQLRRCEPAVHAGRRQVRLGLCQHQPARVLRRRRQDLRVRDRRAARLALPAPRRLSGRRRNAAAANPEGVQELREIGLVEGDLPRFTRRRRRVARRSFARSRQGVEYPGAGQAEHDREVDRDRQSGGRVPGAARGPFDRRRRARWSPTRRSSQGIQLLAETEGIFTEPAGGATVAATRQLIERGAHPARRIDRDLHHRQRIQDGGGPGRPRRAARPHRPFARGVRSEPGGASARRRS